MGAAAPAARFIEEHKRIRLTQRRPVLAHDPLLHVHHVPPLLANAAGKPSSQRSIEHNSSEPSRRDTLARPSAQQVNHVGCDLVL